MAMSSRKKETMHSRESRGDNRGGELMSNWMDLKEAVRNAPCAPGIFKIGQASGDYVEVVYIASSSSQRTLREIITCILYGFEGGERLAMMAVNPRTRKKLMVQWIESCCPEELIEDELEEYIATNHRIPEYNIPIDDSKGLYVFVDNHVYSEDKVKCTEACCNNKSNFT